MFDFPKNAIGTEAHAVAKQEEPLDEVPMSTEAIDPQPSLPDTPVISITPMIRYIRLRIMFPCLVPPQSVLQHWT